MQVSLNQKAKYRLIIGSKTHVCFSKWIACKGCYSRRRNQVTIMTESYPEIIQNCNSW